MWPPRWGELLKRTLRDTQADNGLGLAAQRMNGSQIATVGLSLALITTVALAQENLREATEQSRKAAKVFQEIMSTPDKTIPRNILDDAECVAVFPDVVKAAFGVGGRGVASCRTSQGWSAPAFFNLGGGSVGWQIGVDVTDYVMLFMTEEGMNSLLSNELTLGGNASVAAGPVGREATKTVLKDARAKAPDAVQVFPKTLAQYSTRRLSSP